MSLNLLGAFRDPAMVLDDRALVIGMNSAAAELLGLTGGAAIGRPCYEVLQARDAATSAPCAVGCSVMRKNGAGWLEVRDLRGFRGPTRDIRCMLLRSAIQGEPTTLVLLRPGPELSQTAAALAEEIAARTLPALLSVSDPADAALAVLGSALRLSGADAGQVRLAVDGKGPLAPSAAIGDVGAAVSPFAAANGPEPDDELSLQARRLIISPRRSSAASRAGPGLRWAVTAPVFSDSRLTGAITVVGGPPTFSIAQAARVLTAIAGHLGLFLRWLPRRESAPRMRVMALGGFSMEVDGRPMAQGTFRRKSALDVLRLLAAAEGYTLSRGDLATALWPGVSPRRAAANLRPVLHSLRHDLEPELPPGEASSFIYADRERVGLKKLQIWIDAAEFTKARASFLDLARLGYRDESIRAGQYALGLYRGPFQGDDCRDDRGLAERARLHELFVDLTLGVGRALMAAGDYQSAENAFRRALSVESAREELHAALIRLLVNTGRHTDAREQLRRCIRVVRAALGVDPCPETLSLVRESGDRQHWSSTALAPPGPASTRRKTAV